MNSAWIAWEDDTSIRSRVLAEELGAEYYAFTRLSNSRGLAWLRYALAMTQTARAMWRHRKARAVFAQNPSIVLAWQAALIGRLLGLPVVIDLHTHFVNPTGIRKLLYDFFNGYSLRHCTAIIVTNEAYRREVMERTTRPVWILPDKVPAFDTAGDSPQLKGRQNVLYICTFSPDEPWQEVIAAASLWPEHVCVYVSGRSPVLQDRLADNLVLTGYLPRADYERLLQSVDIVMVLTTAEDNLVCGGYEAVAAEKPLILSDTPALRQLFRLGATYTENDRASIADAIRRACEGVGHLRDEVQSLKTEMNESWDRQWRAILNELER